MTQQTKQKLYCFVDESGQDTAAQSGRTLIFVVAITIFGNNRDEIEKTCLTYEKISGKFRKWNKERKEKRLKYITLILNDKRFKQSIYFSSLGPFENKPDYDLQTQIGIKRAFVHMPLPEKYEVDIFIDGISETKQVEYKRRLRNLNIRVHRIRRARDESYPLIRLADAVAGTARQAIEGNKEALALIRKAKELQTLVET
ncbi:MAG: hypothetical protein G01um101416_911 [Microgenomates group bacterium Gr01-1014_16]|nr:MAG: hypothetical protein G01um101416_911 [Microgenomates group bacterium Gr01-1014_16]